MIAALLAVGWILPTVSRSMDLDPLGCLFLDLNRQLGRIEHQAAQLLTKLLFWRVSLPDAGLAGRTRDAGERTA